MAFKKRTGETKKKKGPKGKRARAKAKLDRQWGETIEESELQLQQFRPGKSRLLQQKPQATSVGPSPTSPKRRAKSSPEAIGYPPENDLNDVYMSSDDSDDGNGDALGMLLQSIRKKQSSIFQEQHSELSKDEDDEESDDDSDSVMRVQSFPKDETNGAEDQSDLSDIDAIHACGDGDESDDNDEPRGATDPFSSHFNREPFSESNLGRAISAAQKTIKVSFPLLDSSLEFQCSDGRSEHDPMSLFPYNRQVLKLAWKRANAKVLRDTETEKKLLSPLQSALYPSLVTYKDMFIAAENRKNREAIQNILALHVMNHVLTSRGRVQRNNRKAKEEEHDDTLRDQGFTRPTVLILLPTRGTCYTFLNKLLALVGNPAHVDNMDRFAREYGPPEIDEEVDGKERRRKKNVLEAKGPEWQELFGEETNGDDDFKIGVSVTPKVVSSSESGGNVSIKLYSDFYRSDIIIASPLGLKMSLGGDEDEESSPDVDFLSSIEIFLVAHSSVLLMQNWDHVNGVLECLNRQPKKNNDTDFGRVRNYLLAGQAQHWRQLIVSSSLIDPHIAATFKHHSKSIAGRLKLRLRTPLELASLCNVLVRVKQVFQRIPCSSFAIQGQDRLRFFERRVLPQIRKQRHTMIFIPSYFDFVSARNLLLRKEIEFVSVTEYSRVSEVTRGRARFLQGIKPLMLYTGRAHFFQRHVIKGVRHLILYGLPEHGEFYSGLVNTLNAGLEGGDDDDYLDATAPLSCLSMFTKYDALALERIVGIDHCNRMINGDKTTFMFCS